MSNVETLFQQCNCDYRNHCLAAHERKCFTAGYDAALKTVEKNGNSLQQLKAEILPLLIRALDEGTVSIETNDIRRYVKEVVELLQKQNLNL